MWKYSILYRSTVKRILYLLLTFAITLTAVPGISFAGTISYKDINDQQPSWPYVNYLSNEGATSGYPDGTFRPQEGTTRAQLAKMITLMAGWSLEAPKKPTFRDIPATHWAFQYVETAVKHGILKGYTNGTFLPNRLINKAELAVAVMRFTGKDFDLTIPRDFTDVSMDNWAYPAIAAAVDAGILSWTEGKVEPNAPATRSRTAKALAVAALITPSQEEIVINGHLRVDMGTVTVYKGNGEVGQKINPGQGDILVGKGDKIQTDSQGTAKITFDDGSALQLDPDTIIEIIKAGGLRTIRWDGTPMNSVDDLQLNLVEGVIYGGLAPRYEVVPESSQSEQAEEGNPDQPADQPVQQSEKSASRKGPVIAANQGLTIVADSSTVYADGKTKVVLTVKLVDAEGRAIKAPKEGVTVNLGTSAGVLNKKQIKIPSGGSEGKATWTAPSTMPQGKTATIDASGKNILGELAIKIMDAPWWRQSQSKKVRVTVNMPWGVAGVRGSIFEVHVRGIKILVGEGVLKLTSGDQEVVINQLQEVTVSAPDAPLVVEESSTETLLEWKQVIEFVMETVQKFIDNAPADLTPRAVDTPPVKEDKLDDLIPAPYPTGGSEGTGAGSQGTGNEGTGNEGTGSEGTGNESTGSESTGNEGTGPDLNLLSDIMNTIQDEIKNINDALERVEAQSVTDTTYKDEQPVIDQEVPPDTTSPSVTANPESGTFRNVLKVELTSSEAATIYYTTDGSTPTDNSSRFTEPIYVGSLQSKTTTTLRYAAVDGAGNWSQVYNQYYAVDPITVSASPAGGTYKGVQEVTLTSSVVSKVYYTADGSSPTTESSFYTSSIPVGNQENYSTTTLKFMAADEAGNMSQVYTELYYIDNAAPVIEASPEAGYYQPGQLVTLIANDTSPTTLYYTTDGTVPTASSTQYIAPISINDDTTLKVLAVDAAGNHTLQTINYFNQLPVTVYDPQGGLSPSARVAVMQYHENTNTYTQIAAGVTNSGGIFNLSTSSLQLGMNYLMVASSMSGGFLYYQHFDNSNINGITIDATNARKISVSSWIDDSPLSGTLYASLLFYDETGAESIAYSYPLTYLGNGQSEVWMDQGNYYLQVSSSESAKYVRENVSVDNFTTELQIQAQEMLPVTVAVYGNYTQSWLSPRNSDTRVIPNMANTNDGTYYLSPGDYSLYSWLDNGNGRYEVGPNSAELRTGGSLYWAVGGDLSGYLDFGNEETSFIRGNPVLFQPGIRDAFGNDVTEILGGDLQRAVVTVTITIMDSEEHIWTISDSGPWISFTGELGTTLEWIVPEVGLTSGYCTARVTITTQTAGTFYGEKTFWAGSA